MGTPNPEQTRRLYLQQFHFTSEPNENEQIINPFSAKDELTRLGP